MRRICCALALLLACSLCVAQPTTRLTVNQFLDGLLSMSAEKCQNRDDAPAKRYESQGRAVEAYAIRSGEKTICECVPNRIKNLRSNISSSDRDRVVSQAEFTTQYMPDIVNLCAAAQLRSAYGDGCVDRFNGKVSDAKTFCPCMSSKLQAVSDAEIAEIGGASADYLPLAAEAQRKGLPAPVKPQALVRFGAIEMSCRKK